MSKNITEICPLTQSCINFKKINSLVIGMVSKHYFDLQMYANFVFDIDNDKTNLSDQNNFYSKILGVQKEYQPEYPTITIFSEKNMTDLEKIVKNILVAIKNNRISAEKYLSDIEKIDFFGSGAASSTILLKMYRKISNKETIPLIVKLIPFQLPHHYQYLPYQNRQQLNQFIWKYIESPGYALYIKEAWMYCFSKNELLKYTPTFTCIANCYIIDGFPIWNLDDLTKIYNPYAQKRLSAGKSLPYKKWFNILLDPASTMELKNEIMAADYGCFEMRQIEGTLDDLVSEPGSFNLSIIFEYLYTKVVAAFIGRIIFTDDHFGNVAYRTVDYNRLYKIKCNGCNYIFYMPPGKMVQFIDLERYVFNYSRYDIYTNTALRSIPDSDFNGLDKKLAGVKNLYQANNYIFDKSLSALLQQPFGEKNFSDASEYYIMLKILTSPFIHDIKTFCQIMETNLPEKYLVAPNNNKTIEEYYLDLDNDSLRVITFDNIYQNIDA